MLPSPYHLVKYVKSSIPSQSQALHPFGLLLGQDLCLLQDPHAKATLEAIHVHHPGGNAGLLPVRKAWGTAQGLVLSSLFSFGANLSPFRHLCH